MVTKKDKEFEALYIGGKGMLTKAIRKKYAKELGKLIGKAAADNVGLEPYISEEDRYVCGTCGTRNKAHPVTSYCFICDTDNWCTNRNIEEEEQ